MSVLQCPITDIMYSRPEPKALKLALPVLNPAPPRDSRLDKLETKNRAWLVDELLRSNPRLSDRRILSHISIEKLARMVLAAWDARAVQMERTA